MLGACSERGILDLALRDQTALSIKDNFRTIRIGGTIGLPQTKMRMRMRMRMNSRRIDVMLERSVC
jgi:hypothetical protein